MAYTAGAQEATLTEMEGMFKRIYADEVERAVPIDTVIQNRVKFSEADSDGENFNMPVHLVLPTGITHSRTGQGAFALKLPIAGQTKHLQITGSQHVLRNALAYEIAAKSTSSEKAFKKMVVENMLEMKDAMAKFLEIDLMYGQSSLAQASGAGTSDVVPIAAATWASGIWSGLDGIGIQVYDNTGGAPNSTLRAAATLEVNGVDFVNKTLTVDDDTAIEADDHFLFGVNGTSEMFDGTNWNVMVGLHTICSSTAGTLWMPSATAAAYSLWKANAQTAGSSDLSFGVIQKAAAAGMAKGARGDYTCICSPVTWANLLTDQAALRRYGAERKTMENGAEAIKFYSQTGSISIESSIYCKEGYAYLIQPKKFKRIGPTDVTFDMSKFGFPGGSVFRHLENNAGVEYRCYSHQALFTSKLGHCTLINNIVNS